MAAGPIVAVIAALALVAPATHNPPVQHDEQISYQRFETFRDWRSGTAAGTVAVPALRPYLTFGRAAGSTTYAGKTWEYASWTSPVRSARGAGVAASQLVASWNADTPAGTWLQVELQGTYTNGDQHAVVRHGPLGLRRRGHPADHRSTTRATRTRPSGPTRSRSTTPAPGYCCRRTACG